MPDKNISSAKCHICGQKIPFTNGNPKELIQHMFGCHEHESGPKFGSPCWQISSKPCVTIKECPNKLVKCSTCGGQRQAAGAGKSATICDAPAGTPTKYSICVSPGKEFPGKSGCPSMTTSNDRKSSLKNDAVCMPECNDKKSSSRIDLGEFKTPVKLRIRCRSCKLNKTQDGKNKACPKCLKLENSRNKCGDGEAGKNRRSSLLEDKSKDCVEKKCPIEKNRRLSNVSADSVDMKNTDGCGSNCSDKEINKKISPSDHKWNKPRRNSKTGASCASLNSVDKKDGCFGESGLTMPQEKNRRLSDTSRASIDKSAICNRTVCFANHMSEGPGNGKPVKQYCPNNLKKRKGSKEMYKTTLESWSAGCGNINCPSCHMKVIPLIRKKRNKIAFTSVGASLLMTCWPFCFLIPMLHTCSVDIYCPCCKYKLGVYNSSTGKTKSVCRKENTPKR